MGQLEGSQKATTMRPARGTLAYLKTIGVYTVTCKRNGVVYVGSSTDVSHRTSGHLSKLRSGKHELRNMVADFLRYGEGSFEFAVVSTFDNIEDAKSAEADLIARYFKEGRCYNRLAVKFYTARIEDNKYARVKRADQSFDPGAKLKAWMEANGKKVSDLRAVIGASRYTAYRLMWGGIPNREDMGRICHWTQGEVNANSFYDVEKWERELAAKRAVA
jgi:group I intron endonuclease